MKKMKKSTLLEHVFFTIALLLFFSCEKNRSIHQHNLKINNVKIAKSIAIDSFIAGIEIIQLEMSNKKSILSDVANKLLFYKDKIIIVDYILGNYIAIFDSKGKFINKIDVSGQGPGEVSDIRSVTINKQNDQLEVFSANEKKEVHYSLDGKFIEEIKSQYYYQEKFSFETSSIYYSSDLANTGAFPNSACFELFRTNKSSVIPIREVDPNLFEKHIGITTPNPFFNEGESIFFCKHFSDTIFSISDESIEIAYKIDFKSNSIPKKFWEKDFKYSSKIDAADGENFAYLTGKFFKNKRFISMIYWFDRSSNWFIYDLSTRKTIVNSKTINLKKFNLDLLPPTQFTEDGFVYYISAPVFKDFIATQSSNNKLPKKFIEIDRKLTEKANPIILKIKLKK
jgi:hypothetical protein